ncbi:MAG: hypothetical protein HY319_03115 [Armatimonadetes bacterium]|nr:hypothetical protein [Armatimonadota bacterium]
MTCKLVWLVLVLLAAALPAGAQTRDVRELEAQIESTLREFDRLGQKPFETRWPGGALHEAYKLEPDGTRSYSKFFPAGNFAVRYQKKSAGSRVYEKWHGNGQEAIILLRDERITDYTAYWPNGVKKAKYQYNRHTKERFYNAWSEKGEPVVP